MEGFGKQEAFFGWPCLADCLLSYPIHRPSSNCFSQAVTCLFLNSIKPSATRIAEARSCRFRFCSSFRAHSWRPISNLNTLSYSAMFPISSINNCNCLTSEHYLYIMLLPVYFLTIQSFLSPVECSFSGSSLK